MEKEYLRDIQHAQFVQASFVIVSVVENGIRMSNRNRNNKKKYID